MFACMYNWQTKGRIKHSHELTLSCIWQMTEKEILKQWVDLAFQQGNYFITAVLCESQTLYKITDV